MKRKLTKTGSSHQGCFLCLQRCCLLGINQSLEGAEGNLHNIFVFVFVCVTSQVPQPLLLISQLGNLTNVWHTYKYIVCVYTSICVFEFVKMTQDKRQIFPTKVCCVAVCSESIKALGELRPICIILHPAANIALRHYFTFTQIADSSLTPNLEAILQSVEVNKTWQLQMHIHNTHPTNHTLKGEYCNFVLALWPIDDLFIKFKSENVLFDRRRN